MGLELFYNFCLAGGFIAALCLGQWRALIFGATYYVFAKLILSFALIPGAFFANLSEMRYSRGAFISGLCFSGLNGLYVDLIQSLSCTNVFWIICGHAKDPGLFIPLVLFAYAIATTPWFNMARDEPDSFATLMGLHAINLGCLLLIGVSFFYHPSFFQAVILMGAPPIVATFITLAVGLRISKALSSAPN